jgi:hypothetical protein
MKRVVFLLEEYSIRVLLEGLLPRLIPGLAFLCVNFAGKQDLEKKIPTKLRAWREPGVRFVVVRDNDGAECEALKAKLVQLCAASGREDTLVRLACQELEAWYLGDPEALAAVFEDERLRAIGKQARYRDPDAVVQPSAALAELAPRFQKVSSARAMGAHLTDLRNTSASFQAFVAGVRRVFAEMATVD